MGQPVEHRPGENPHENRGRDSASFWNTPLTRRGALKLGTASAVGIASGLVTSHMYRLQYLPLPLAEWANIAATEIIAPDAPLSIPEDTEPKLKKVMTLYNNMITNFGTQSALLLEENRDKNIRYAMVWPYSRAIEASYTMRFVPGLGQEAENRYENMLQALNAYWNDGPPGYNAGYDPGVVKLSRFNNKLVRFNNRIKKINDRFKIINVTLKKKEEKQDERYIDDNIWVGLILMREYHRTQNPRLLARAKQIFDLVQSQIDRRGGVLWKVQFPDEEAHGRHMVSNGPAVMLGIELHIALYKRTRDRSYLDFCDNLYSWINDNLQDKRNGLYFDAIDYKGNFGDVKWTYNQGVMIGAMTKLHEADPKRYPLLGEAVQLTRRAIDYFEGEDRELYSKKDPKYNDGFRDNAFNGIFFQNMLYLASQFNNPTFTHYVRGVLQERVNRLSDMYSNLLDHAGALHLATLAAMDPKDYFHLFESPLSIRTQVS